MKTVKVSREHHRCLKTGGAELGLPLQDFLELILEFSFSEDPVLKAARDEYLQKVDPLRDAMIKTLRDRERSAEGTPKTP